MNPPAAGIVLAAGSSRRTGGVEKLIVPVEGRAMVRRVTQTALAAGLDPVLVVVAGGARGAPVREAVGGLPVVLVTNPEPTRGLASSLVRGVGALPKATPAAAILLGDMPWVRAETIRALVAASESAAARSAVVPVHAGRRGNPVLWGAGFFADIVALQGDRGARSVLERHPGLVREVEVDDPGILRDVDTVDDLERLRQEVSWPT